MKLLLTLLFLFFSIFSQAQIICIYCYDQNDSISQNVNNLVLNGGFEFGCGPQGLFCPSSTNYACDITNWTCSGGGSSTYANTRTQSANFLVVEGAQIAYFGNSFCNACSPIIDDTSCITNDSCTVSGVPAGYPENDISYGGTTGVNLEQTVSGLTFGDIYVLEFWSGGEGSLSFTNDGLFGVDIGFGYTFLRNPPTPIAGIGKRYVFIFKATSSTHTIRFTNWGHICNTCSELVLDNVRLYTLGELSPAVPPCNIFAAFTAPNTICPGTCVDFTNLSSMATSYQWNFSGAIPPTSSDINPTNICYAASGSYDVQLIAANATDTDTITLSNYITVFPSPPPQGILQNGDTLFAIAGSASYQWYFNSNIITGATNYFYVAPQSGNYNVVATDSNSCEVEAVINNVIAGLTPALSKGEGITAFPNPVSESFELRGSELNETSVQISVYNVLGEKIPLAVNCCPLTVDCRPLQPGIYLLELVSSEKIYRTKFVKQ